MAGNLSWERAEQWEKLAQKVPEVTWEVENIHADHWKATVDHCDHKIILFLSNTGQEVLEGRSLHYRKKKKQEENIPLKCWLCGSSREWILSENDMGPIFSKKNSSTITMYQKL